MPAEPSPPTQGVTHRVTDSAARATCIVLPFASKAPKPKPKLPNHLALLDARIKPTCRPCTGLSWRCVAPGCLCSRVSSPHSSCLQCTCADKTSDRTSDSRPCLDQPAIPELLLDRHILATSSPFFVNLIASPHWALEYLIPATYWIPDCPSALR